MAPGMFAAGKYPCTFCAIGLIRFEGMTLLGKGCRPDPSAALPICIVVIHDGARDVRGRKVLLHFLCDRADQIRRNDVIGEGLPAGSVGSPSDLHSSYSRWRSRCSRPESALALSVRSG